MTQSHNQSREKDKLKRRKAQKVTDLQVDSANPLLLSHDTVVVAHCQEISNSISLLFRIVSLFVGALDTRLLLLLDALFGITENRALNYEFRSKWPMAFLATLVMDRLPTSTTRSITMSTFSHDSI